MTEKQLEQVKMVNAALFRDIELALLLSPVFADALNPELEQFRERLIDFIRHEHEVFIIHRIEILELALKFDGDEDVVCQRKIDELLGQFMRLVKAPDCLVTAIFYPLSRPKKRGSEIPARFGFLHKARTFCLRLLNKMSPACFGALRDEGTQSRRQCSDDGSPKSGERRDD